MWRDEDEEQRRRRNSSAVAARQESAQPTPRTRTRAPRGTTDDPGSCSALVSSGKRSSSILGDHREPGPRAITHGPTHFVIVFSSHVPSQRLL